MTNASPSITSADIDDFTGVFNIALLKTLQSMDGALPARVIAYDVNKKRVSVQPLIQMVKTNRELVPRAVVANIPVLQIGAGGFLLNFNITPGDLGTILAYDRDVSLFFQSYDMSAPNTYRLKNFADAIFIPQVFKNYTIADEDVNNMVLQNLAGTVKISLGSDKIKISAPTVEIDSDILNIAAPVVGITANTSLNITTPTLAVQGNITASGSITPDTP